MPSIAEQITSEFFTLDKMLEKGFTNFPGGTVIISVDNLRKYLKSINDKIKELENVSNGND